MLFLSCSGPVGTCWCRGQRYVLSIKQLFRSPDHLTGPNRACFACGSSLSAAGPTHYATQTILSDTPSNPHKLLHRIRIRLGFRHLPEALTGSDRGDSCGDSCAPMLLTLIGCRVTAATLNSRENMANEQQTQQRVEARLRLRIQFEEKRGSIRGTWLASSQT